MSNIKEKFMKEALQLAMEAEKTHDIPVGAVIVKDGEVIGRGYNRIEDSGFSTAHAEILAIEDAERNIGHKWLAGADMYTTLEPCAMCAGAIVLARISNLYIGTPDFKTGAAGSLFLIAGSDKLNHNVHIEFGILEEECRRLVKAFFKKLRRG